VAFFVLFAAMSVGLNDFIEDELSRPRTTHIYLESGSPTPFSPDDVGLVELVASLSEVQTGVSHWVTPRAQLPISVSIADHPITLWGVHVPSGPGVASPPYDPSSLLDSGRHLDPFDGANTSAPLPAVLGQRALNALYPHPRSHSLPYIGLSPDESVDPWWMSDAEDYPLEGQTSTVAHPRGPIGAEVVGRISPGQSDDLDWGIFVPLESLLVKMGQHDDILNKTYYPQMVVTIDNGNSVDVRDLQQTIVETLPGVQGTDDFWDPEEFKATYGGAATAFDSWLLVISAVLVVMLVAGVSDTTLVAVTDRRREIATLRAVGIGRRRVSALVLMEVMLLAVVGLIVGLAIGSGLALLFGYLHDSTGGAGVFLAPVTLDTLVMAGAAVLAIGSAALAAMYPASRAAGQSPMEALRYE
jgi:hypothetical protein